MHPALSYRSPLGLGLIVLCTSPAAGQALATGSQSDEVSLAVSTSEAAGPFIFESFTPVNTSLARFDAAAASAASGGLPVVLTAAELTAEVRIEADALFSPQDGSPPDLPLGEVFALIQLVVQVDGFAPLAAGGVEGFTFDAPPAAESTPLVSAAAATALPVVPIEFFDGSPDLLVGVVGSAGFSPNLFFDVLFERAEFELIARIDYRFDIIPGPSAAALLATAALFAARRRR